MKLTYQELSTVLAALRVFQECRSSHRPAFADVTQMDHFQDVDPLSDEEIDQLCERLNFRGKVRLSR